MKKRKVVLLGLLVEHSGRKSPCLALYNLKAYAQEDRDLKEKLDIRIHEQFVFQDTKVIIDLLEKEKPDVIALSCYLWSTEKLISTVEEYCRGKKDILVFLGGPDAGPNAEKLLKRHNFISGVIKGEGEEAFKILLGNIVNGGDWKVTNNLVCKVGDKVVFNPMLPDLEISKIPLAFKMEEFIQNYGRWLYLETARGCKYNCAYCNFYNRNAKRRIRSFLEIKDIVDEFCSSGGTDISFIDPGFNQDRQRFHEVIELLSEKKLKVDGFEINVEELTDEDIPLLAQITKGTMLGIGLQTTNKEALRVIGRAYNAERFKDRMNKLRSVGVDYAVDMIFGLPGDNYEYFKRTYDEAYSFKPTQVRVYNLLTLPDTRLFFEAEKHGLVFDDEPPYITRYCNTFTKEDMKKAQRFLYAHSIMSTYSSNSIAFMLFAEEMNEAPSRIIEDLLSGNWRNNIAVTDEELESWKYMGNVEERENIVRTFVSYKFRSKYNSELPTALKDIFEFQFHTGAVNVSRDEVYNNKTELDFNSLDIYQLLPRLNNRVRIFKLNTDVLNTFKERPCIKDIKQFDDIIMVMFRTEAFISYYKVSKGVEHILNQIDGKTPYGNIVERSLSGISSCDQKELLKVKINKGLSDLTKKQVIIWD